ncbi:MAG: hypothetical protein HGB26_00460 [Desulfobulbaceae bacterium]|nr:hypothetical protein [Desulfobulbaceae bacterium]
MSIELITNIGTAIAVALVSVPILQTIKKIFNYKNEINLINKSIISIKQNSIEDSGSLKHTIVSVDNSYIEFNKNTESIHLIINTNSNKNEINNIKKDLEILSHKIYLLNKTNKLDSKTKQTISSDIKIIYDLVSEDGDVISIGNGSLAMEKNND